MELTCSFAAMMVAASGRNSCLPRRRQQTTPRRFSATRAVSDDRHRGNDAYGVEAARSRDELGRRAVLSGVLVSGLTLGSAGASRAGLADETAQALLVRMLRSKNQRETTEAIVNGEDVENPFGRELVETSSGLMYSDVRVGLGDPYKTGSVIVAHVKGLLPDGSVFDDSRVVGSPLVMSAGVRIRGVCEGLEEGLLSMRPGGVRLLAVPNDLAFGKRVMFGSIGIVPAGSAVRYEVEALRCLDTDAGLVCCTEPDFPCKTPTLLPADAIEQSPLMRPPTTPDMTGLE